MIDQPGLRCEVAAMLDPLRSVASIQISLRTSIGEVSGELWSDGLCVIASPLGDADRNISVPEDLSALLADVCVPDAEAVELAMGLWDREIAAQREAWERDGG
jgi:hypothetical protein